MLASESCNRMSKINQPVPLLLLFVATTAIAGGLLGQESPVAATAVTVQYLDDAPQQISLEDIKKLPETKLSVKDRDGKEGVYTGVYLHEFLDLTPAPLGESLRGAGLGLFLLAEAKDGYRVLFALPELDPEFSDRRVLLAYAKNGQPLDANDGPYRLVVPADKRPARWIRMLTKIYILDGTGLVKKTK